MNYRITFSGRFHYRFGGGVSLHSHSDDYQLQLVYQGGAMIQVNDLKFSIKKGDVVFIKKGDLHYFNVNEADGMKTLEVKFESTDNDLDELFNTINTIFQDQGDQLYSLFSHIVLEGQRKVHCYKMMSNALLLESLVIMARISHKGIPTFDKSTSHLRSKLENMSPAIEAATDYIYKNINRNFTLQEMADGCGYNRDYLYRAIKKELGISAVQYVSQLKFEQAKRLIHHSELTLSEISWNLGFDSIQYFSRFFKSHAKISPSEYSNKVRNTIRTDY